MSLLLRNCRAIFGSDIRQFGLDGFWFLAGSVRNYYRSVESGVGPTRKILKFATALPVPKIL